MITPKLRANLDYYRNHEQLLKAGIYKTIGIPTKLTNHKTLNEIDTVDFLNYFLIHRAENTKYATYQDRLNHLNQSSTWLEYIIDLNGTIKNNSVSRGEQEHLGECS